MNIRKISKTYRLTKAESKILNFVSKGLTTQEIANVLSISSKTVETHRSNCVKKLKLEGKKDALLRFIINTKYQG